MLSGGGARAAYQVGVLGAVARIVDPTTLPFGIICGTSAGAINAAALATRADDFRGGVAGLLRLWRNISVDQVYRADFATVSTHGVRWLAAALTGARGPADAASMFDNRPLRTLLQREIDTARIETQLRDGHLRALAINATSYSTGHAVTFYQGVASIKPWARTRRHGEPSAITIEHLLASTAIPFIFPAVRVGDDFYADGSVRQIAPLSPALHLGARRMLVIAVGQFFGQRSTRARQDAPEYPSFAQVAGHALSSVFLDNLSADLERMWQTNQLSRMIPAAQLADHGLQISEVDALVIGPTRDLGELALRHSQQLPAGARYLLHSLGGTESNGGNLLSYLLFDRHYCRELITLGFKDAMSRRDEIEAFIAGDKATFLPVFPPEFLR